MINPHLRAVDRIDPNLPVDLKALMQLYCLADEFDAMHKGVVDEHAEVLKDIQTLSYFNKTPSDHPTFIIAVGQTGSGKSNLSIQILRNNRNLVKIDSDEYKSFRKDTNKIQQKYLSKYAYLTGPDSYRHRDEMITDAMNKKYNILLEIAPSMKEGLFVDIDAVLSQGYNVEIDVLAVSRLNSLLSIHERYEDQLGANFSAAKLTSIARHNDSYNSLNDAIKLLQNKNVRINVYKRGSGTLASPVLVYSSANASNCCMFETPLDAINSVRAEDERQTCEHFNSRHMIILSRMLAREAPIEQQQQLLQVQELYTQSLIARDL